MIAWLILFLLLLSQSAQADHTTLHTTATALSPGQWAQVSGMTNLSGTAVEPAWDNGGTGGFYDGPQPGWNSTSKKLLFTFAEHGRGTPGICTNFPNHPHTCWTGLVSYDDTTNTWTTGGPYPKYSNNNPVSGSHVYGHIAWDNTNQVMYVRKYDASPGSLIEFFRYCTNASPSYCASQGANTWTQIASANMSAFGNSTCCEGIGWHPTLNGGTLLYFAAYSSPGNTCAALMGYRETTGTWSMIDNGSTPTCKFGSPGSGGYYLLPSSVKNLVMFGGGASAKWTKIDGAGTITALDNHPNGCFFGTTNGTMSQGAVDPVTGNAIFIGCTTTGQLWQLNPTASPGAQWTLLDSNLAGAGEICNVSRFPTENCGGDFAATPISTYGVIGFWKFRAGSPNFAEYWIYKHATSSDTTPPTVSITAPTAGASVSGPLVTVTATASDNVGVAGVQFKVDGTNVGAEDTVSPYSIAWNSTTVTDGSHAITALARDGAGNTTTSTTVNVTVTNGGGGGADFATRCIGALFCNGFDSAGDLGGDGWGNARGRGPADGTVNCGVNNCPTIDTTVKVSGAGAMKFTIPPGATGNAAGSYWANPAADFSIRFGANQTYYVQFRQRVTASFFPAILTGNGKIHWVSTTPDLPGCSTSNTTNCFASCTENELVNQNNYGVAADALPRWYNGCPGANNFEYIEPVTPGQWKLQNARTGVGCTYDNVQAGNRFPPSGNCFPYYPDQWVTYSYKISLGSLGTGSVGGFCFNAGSPVTPNLQNCYYGNQIQARMGLDGQPLEEVLNWTLPVIAKDQLNPTELKYGKIYFSPYTASATIPSGAAMWFDELIISQQPIPDPGAPPVVNSPSQIRVTRR